jgi:hypothetical protein
MLLCRKAVLVWLQLYKNSFGCLYNNNNNNKSKVTILWNQKVQTNRSIPNNKPDIIIRDNEKGTCLLKDVAISGDRNVIKKGS